MNKRLFIIVICLWSLAYCAFGAQYASPFDPGAVRKTDQAARVDTINASFTGDIDVTGDVGAATLNGVAPLTAAEKTQALVGSTTVNFLAQNGSFTGDIDVGGSMVASMSVGFLATLSTTAAVATQTETTIVFNTEVFDAGGNYDNTTGIFTAPISGYYQFDISAEYQKKTATLALVSLWRDGSVIVGERWAAHAIDARNSIGPSVIMFVTQGSTVRARAYNYGTTTADNVIGGAGTTFFSGRFIGR